MNLDKHTANLVYRTCKTFVSHMARHGNVAGASLRLECDACHVYYKPGAPWSLLLFGRGLNDEKYEGIAAFREAYGLEEARIDA